MYSPQTVKHILRKAFFKHALVNTPYDDVFRTLLNDCSSLIIPVINEVFGEHYRGDEKVVFSPNEYFLNQQGGNGEKRVSDSNFAIVSGETKKYHWECSSRADSSLLVRFFEYDTQIALDGGELKGDTLKVSFPHSAVLFLRHTRTTPDRLRTEIDTPGGSVSYDIPAMKAQRYSVDEIFQKGLLFLVPFYIFTHEKRFGEYQGGSRGLAALEEEYRGIRSRLESLLEAGGIDEYTKCTVIDMSGKVVEHIARNYEDVREGVKSAMGGKILDYEAKQIKMAGVYEGEARGEARGIVEAGLDFGLSENDILERLQRKMHVSLHSAQELLKMFAKPKIED